MISGSEKPHRQCLAIALAFAMEIPRVLVPTVEACGEFEEEGCENAMVLEFGGVFALIFFY